MPPVKLLNVKMICLQIAKLVGELPLPKSRPKVREIGVESQGISWNVLYMRVLIVEKSSLSRNVFRILLEERFGMVRFKFADSLQELEDFSVKVRFDLIILDGKIVNGIGGVELSSLADIALWAETPKIIISLSSESNKNDWNNDALLQVVQRPFHPKDFWSALNKFEFTNSESGEV